MRNSVWLADRGGSGFSDYALGKFSDYALGKVVYIKELGASLFLFQFYQKICIKRVAEGSPWTFNKTGRY